jgi:hypothetical protein
LNKITIADPFPLPRDDEILEAVAPASIFSLLDVQEEKCFWQVIFDPKFASKTSKVFHQISDSAKLKILYPIESLIFISRGSFVLHLHPVRNLASPS